VFFTMANYYKISKTGSSCQADLLWNKSPTPRVGLCCLAMPVKLLGMALFSRLHLLLRRMRLSLWPAV
jgi:hypothetical protein